MTQYAHRPWAGALALFYVLSSVGCTSWVPIDATLGPTPHPKQLRFTTRDARVRVEDARIVDDTLLVGTALRANRPGEPYRVPLDHVTMVERSALNTSRTVSLVFVLGVGLAYYFMARDVGEAAGQAVSCLINPFQEHCAP